MKNTIFVLLSLILLSGCSAKNVLSPSAKDVRIYDSMPSSLECKYIDEVVGSEANMLTFLFVSNHDITVGARNDLRNKAAKIGGNTVVIQRSVFNYTTSTIFVGQVFRCRERIVL